VGCALAARLVSMIKQIKREHDPDILFIEPSEMVVTSEMRQVIAMAKRDIAFDGGPLITLIDGPNCSSLWEERQRLIIGQITDADVIAVSRSDRIDSSDVEAIHARLSPYSQNVCSISTIEDSGVKPIWDVISGAVPEMSPSEKITG
jgi:G3E family GTPase